jgi:hypothetical protein
LPQLGLPTNAYTGIRSAGVRRRPGEPAM